MRGTVIALTIAAASAFSVASGPRSGRIGGVDRVRRVCMQAPPPDDVNARIAYLKEREKALKKIVEQEAAAPEAAAPSGGASGSARGAPPPSNAGANTDIMLRLPEGVQAGQWLDASLPNGVKVRFVAPAGAQAGQLVRVKNPAGDNAAPSGGMASAGSQEEEDEDEEWERSRLRWGG